MKARTILCLMLAVMPVISFAQNDDDMYFVPKKKAKTAQTTTSSGTSAAQSPKRTYTPVERTTDSESYYTGPLRDVDEYNRRGTSGHSVTIITETDTFQVDESQLTLNEKGQYVLSKGYSGIDEEPAYFDDDYVYSSRLSRFHGYGYPYSYYSWYDPWYYDSFYYDPWYYGTYWGYRPWGGYGWHGYYGWHSPWYYGYGWGGYYGWHHPYHYNHHYTYAPSGGRRPGFNGGRSGRTGYYAQGSRTARGGYGTATRSGAPFNSSRRSGISSRSGVNSGRNVGTSSRGISSSSSRSTVNNTSNRGSSSSSRGSGFSGGGRSGGFSGRSGGGFSGGGSRGGGFSGGGSSRGGGGRR